MCVCVLCKLRVFFCAIGCPNWWTLTHVGWEWIIRKRQKWLSLTPDWVVVFWLWPALCFRCCDYSVMCTCANGMRNVLRVDSAQTLESGCCQSHEDAVCMHQVIAFWLWLSVYFWSYDVSGELCRERNVSSAFVCCVCYHCCAFYGMVWCHVVDAI